MSTSMLISAVNHVYLRGGHLRPRVARAQGIARPFLFPQSLYPEIKGSGQGCPLLRASDAHSLSIKTFPSSFASFSWKGTHVGLSAAVERAHSYRARSGSTGPMWVSVQSFFIVGTLRAQRAIGRSPVNNRTCSFRTALYAPCWIGQACARSFVRPLSVIRPPRPNRSWACRAVGCPNPQSPGGSARQFLEGRRTCRRWTQ